MGGKKSWLEKTQVAVRQIEMTEIILPRYPFSSELGWSSSRSDTFHSCKRRYFYNYYSKFDPEIPREQIEHLKKLSSIPMAVGTGIHDVLAAVLNRLFKSNQEIDHQRFQTFVEQSLQQILSKKSLMEVHYGERETPDVTELMTKAQPCLENFLTSKRYDWLREQLHGQSRHLIEPPGFGEARLKGMKIYAKVDFLLEVDSETVIIDWKTGRKDVEKHSRQLLGYAAWAAQNLGISANQIRCVMAYLQPTYEEVEKLPTNDDLNSFANEVAQEIEQMNALCQDPENNIPLSKEHFPMTEHINLCRHCQFRELCDRNH